MRPRLHASKHPLTCLAALRLALRSLGLIDIWCILMQSSSRLLCRCSILLPADMQQSVHSRPLKTFDSATFVLLHRRPCRKYPLLGPEVTLQTWISFQPMQPFAEPV